MYVGWGNVLNVSELHIYISDIELPICYPYGYYHLGNDYQYLTRTFIKISDVMLICYRKKYSFQAHIFLILSYPYATHILSFVL